MRKGFSCGTRGSGIHLNLDLKIALLRVSRTYQTEVRSISTYCSVAHIRAMIEMVDEETEELGVWIVRAQ